MKKIFVMMLAITGLLFATSCSENQDEEATLMLSEKSIDFKTNAKAEKSITVTTNQAEWSVIGSAEWIEAERNGDKLVIKVAKNETITARKGKVLVVAGNANATIEVKQSGVKGNAEINPNNIEVGQYAGNLVVEVVANDKNWTATTEADWLTLTPKQHKYELGIDYQENTARKERIAKVVITVGTTKKELIVKQSGIMFFILPVIDFKKDAKSITAFEEARGSVLRDKNSYSDSWLFDTKSPFFPFITYKMKSYEGLGILEITLLSPDVAVFKAELEAFKAYLVENGFAVEEDNPNNYYNAEKSVLAEILISEEEKLAGVHYIQKFKQDKEYPTFANYPDIAELPWGATAEELKTYEASHNGVLDTENSSIQPEKTYSNYAYSDANAKGETPFYRAYTLIHDKSGTYNNGIGVKQLLYANTELAFYKAPDEKYYLTKEFMKLMLDAGFEYQGGPDNDGNHTFVSTAKNTNLKIRAVNLQNSYVLDVYMIRLDLKK